MKSKKRMLVCLFLLFTQLSITQKIGDKLYEKGLTELQAGDFDKAVKNFNKSIQKNDKFVDAYFKRALSYTLMYFEGLAPLEFIITEYAIPNSELMYN